MASRQSLNNSASGAQAFGARGVIGSTVAMTPTTWYLVTVGDTDHSVGNSLYRNGDSHIEVPVPGVYHVHARVTFQNGIGDGRRMIAIDWVTNYLVAPIQGVEVCRTETSTSGGGLYWTGECSAVFRTTSWGMFRANCYATTGGAGNINQQSPTAGQQSELNVRLLGTGV